MRSALALMLLLCADPARAQADELAALALAERPAAPVPQVRDWRALVEAGAGRERLGAGDGEARRRLSLDLWADRTLAPGIRALFGGRLDAQWTGQTGAREEVFTVKDAYLSWQPHENLILDAGRINQYYGVATGYNPNDYFKRGALRSPVSLDPASIKKNRQGSVMLRAQGLWDGGSLTMQYAPSLRDAAPIAPVTPEWRATNEEGRWVLALSQRITPGFNPQWLLHKADGEAPLLGMNLTTLVNDATVAYVEWSGGRSRSLLAQALGTPAEAAFHNSVSSGLTYTSAGKLSLTLEYQYHGAALDRGQWNALQMAPLPVYWRYRLFALHAQQMPTRQAWFAYLTKQDLLMSNLDLAAMVRVSREDHSRLAWAELRYKWAHDEIALQWQRASGSPASGYGAAAQGQAWQLVVRHFF